MSAKTKTKEFGLSDETPEAVHETNLKRAQDDWQRRSDEAAAKVKLPERPYRIKGDTEAGAWFVEAAEIERSDDPGAYDARDWSAFHSHIFLMSARGMIAKPDPSYYEKWIGRLNNNRPTAKLVWKRVGKKRKGFFTYARALRWLKEYLEPVRDESVYFDANGNAA